MRDARTSLSRGLRGFFDATFFLAVSAAVLYRAAFSPYNMRWAAWLVPAIWLLLIKGTGGEGAGRISGPQAFVSQTAAFYAKIWAASALFWMTSFDWMRQLPIERPLLLWGIFGSTVSLFWVAFMALSRAASRHMRVPVVLAAPIVWCGLEWARKNFYFGGFSYGAIEHTQYENTTLIQLADACGEYCVGMFLVFVGSCVGDISHRFYVGNYSRRSGQHFTRPDFLKIGACALAITIACLYGRWRIASNDKAAKFPAETARIAVLQGVVDQMDEFSHSVRETQSSEYEALSRSVGPACDLVVWPEAAYDQPFYEFPPGLMPDAWKHERRATVDELLAATLRANHEPLVRLANSSKAPLLMGVRTSIFRSDSIALRNSAVLVGPNGQIGPRYDKVNLAPFLECNPIPRLLPNSFFGTPDFVAGVATPGFPVRAHSQLPGKALSLNGADSFTRGLARPLYAAVNICFDSSFPSFIRLEVCALAAEGREPDVLINMSNDGSWRFSAMNDMHMATHVFRAVENRKPYLCATNGGFSAWIDACGRIVRRGKRQTADFILAEIHKSTVRSVYRAWGDWLPIGCFCFDILAAAIWAILCMFAICRRLARGREVLIPRSNVGSGSGI